MVPLIYLGTALAVTALVGQSWRSERGRPATPAFAALGGFIAVAYASFAVYLTGVAELRYLYAIAGAMVPAATAGVFDRLYGAPHEIPRRATRRLTYISGAAAVAYVIFERIYGDSPRASAPDVALGIFTLLCFGLPVSRLLQVKLDDTTQVERARVRVLMVMLGAAALATGLEMLSRALIAVDLTSSTRDLARAGWMIQGGLPPISAVLALVFLYFLNRVIAQEMDLRELVARAFTLSVSAVTLVGLQELVTQSIGAPRSGLWAHHTFLLFLVAWGFLFFHPRLRRAVEQRAGQWFNHPAWRLEQTLAEVDQAMAKALTLDGLDRALLDPIQTSGRAPLVTLYLWSPEHSLYRLTRQRGAARRPLMQTIGPRPFTEGFARRKPYVRDELLRQVQRRAAGHEDAADRIRTMDAMDADLTLPIQSGGAVIGWLNLRASDRADGFAPDEIRRLAATVERTAIILENIASLEQLEEQRRLAALGTMAAGLAHEIRNPLAGIKGAAQYLQGQTDPDEERDFLSVIVGEVDRLNNVVSQFLHYARPLRITAEPTDVGALLRNIVELVRAEGGSEGTRLEVEAPADLPLVPLDTDKVRAVLLNLLQNALSAVGDSGTVILRASRGRMLGPSGVTTACLSISVIDDGPGISADDKVKLFVPFFTTKPDGTGLGLAISRRLVRAHDGEISVRSQPGETVFTVRLPMPEPPAESLPAVRPAESL